MNGPVRVLLSGGAVIDDGDIIPIWFPSRREALDELEARQPRPTVDYPLAAHPGTPENAEVRA